MCDNGGMPKSDILAVSLTSLAVAVTFLLSPYWGWPFLAIGIIGLFVYFRVDRAHYGINPPRLS
jgi:hypothetical protein